MSTATKTAPRAVRLPADIDAWLAIRSKENRRTVSAEIVDALRKTVQEYPLAIFVIDFRSDEAAYHCACIGEHGDEFASGTREEVVAAAITKAREIGLPRSAIKFQTEDFRTAKEIA